MELNKIVEESFAQYSGAVLQSRALVDVRDCLKPSARQIFYCLYTDKFLPSKPFKKTLKAIGSVARMYIHGDSSAEGVIMRAGQPFAMRYPLIEVEGSEGSLIAPQSWAAPRYTASRLSPFSISLFEDIEKDTIDEWRDNYDDTEQYPAVLPSKGFYNIVNGTMGIAVGAASSIPQFNIKEVNNALITLLQNPNATFDEIYCAPDFATGALLLNEDEIKQSLKKGQGAACKLRSVVEFDPKDRCFIVTEIPYGVYTNTICSQLEEILESEDNPGIERFNDLTGEKPLIKIYLNKRANPDKILKFLYKNTSLQYYYGINMTMLNNGRFPKVFTWKEALQAHIDHEKIIYRKGFEYDLKKIMDRIHVLDGLLICLARIEEVIAVIKASNSTTEASKKLCENFLLDTLQAKAVLDMKLSRLAHLEVQKLENERTELTQRASIIQSILQDESKFNNELIKGWNAISSKFGDARRTKILNIESEKDEPLEQKQLSLSFTNKGAVFVTETSTLYSQRRNGVGIKFKLEPSEYIIDNVVGKNTDTILFFTNKGNFYHLKMSDFTIGEKQYLNNFFSTFSFEEIQAAAVLNKSNQKKYIVFLTKQGIIKKTELSEYSLKRNTGATAIKLDPNDEIVSIQFVNDEKLGIISTQGNFIWIETKSINPIGRVTRGVIGMKLNDTDLCAAAHIIPESTKELISVAEDGLIKRTSLDEFRITNKGTKGVKIQKASTLCDFIPISSIEGDILINSTASQIRLKIQDIPISSRGAQGVKAIKLTNQNLVINISLI